MAVNKKKPCLLQVHEDRLISQPDVEKSASRSPEARVETGSG